MKHVVVLSGAGMSAESGLKTFRDAGGLWEGHRVEEVATPEAWESNPELVLQFYNERRKQLFEVSPNPGHLALADLEQLYKVSIITQNVDDLHERAGSTRVLHLHGELKKVRSTQNPDLVYELNDWQLNMGDLCELGSQLRPHIVWFGEEVPMLESAAAICMEADVFILVGTSLQVYPAAGLTRYVPKHIPRYFIDPNAQQISVDGFQQISLPAGQGLPPLCKELLSL